MDMPNRREYPAACHKLVQESRVDDNKNTIGATPDPQLRALASYEALYADEPRRFASPTTADPAVWKSWRVAFRAALRQRLALPEVAPSPPAFTAAPPAMHDGYRRVYLEYASAPDTIVPAWLLLPDDLN